MSYVVSSICDCLIDEEYVPILRELENTFIQFNKLEYVKASKGKDFVDNDFNTELNKLNDLAESNPEIVCNFFISVSKSTPVKSLGWIAIYKVLESHGIKRIYDPELNPIFLYTISFLVLHHYYGNPADAPIDLEKEGIKLAASKGCEEAKKHLRQNEIYNHAKTFFAQNSLKQRWQRVDKAVLSEAWSYTERLSEMIDDGRYAAIYLYAAYAEYFDEWDRLIALCDYLSDLCPDNKSLFEKAKRYYTRYHRMTRGYFNSSLSCTIIGGIIMIATFIISYMFGPQVGVIPKVLICSLGVVIFAKLSFLNLWTWENYKTNVNTMKYEGLVSNFLKTQVYNRLY